MDPFLLAVLPFFLRRIFQTLGFFLVLLFLLGSFPSFLHSFLILLFSLVSPFPRFWFLLPPFVGLAAALLVLWCFLVNGDAALLDLFDGRAAQFNFFRLFGLCWPDWVPWGLGFFALFHCSPFRFDLYWSFLFPRVSLFLLRGSAFGGASLISPRC